MYKRQIEGRIADSLTLARRVTGMEGDTPIANLALVVDDEVAAGAVMSTIREAAGELLTGISLFDIYRGEQLGEGKKSLAFQLTFCAADRSLEEKEINDLREAMLGPLEEKLGAKIRA